jgi:hypothetical protein
MGSVRIPRITDVTVSTMKPTISSKLVQTEISRLPPGLATGLFAFAFFAIRIGTDWLFRSYIPGRPMAPVWSILLTTAIEAGVSSGLVYLLLASVQTQLRAVRLLNHELRNALQVLTFTMENLEPGIAEEARGSINRALQALQHASTLLGRTGYRR